MKTFYLYIVLLLSLGCKAQEFDLRNMKRFDEKVFKDWEVDTSIKRGLGVKIKESLRPLLPILTTKSNI